MARASFWPSAPGSAIVLALAPGQGRSPAGLLGALGIRDLTLAVNALPVLALAWLVLEGRRRVGAPWGRASGCWSSCSSPCSTYLLCLAPTLMVKGEPWGVTLFRWVYLYLPGGSAFRAPGRWSLVFVLPSGSSPAWESARSRSACRGGGVGWLRPPCWRLLLAELSLVPLPWHRFAPTPAVYE